MSDKEMKDNMKKHSTITMRGTFPTPKKKPKLGSGQRFQQLKSKLAAKGAKNPAALAAYIGRKKYGKEKFQELSVAGKKNA